MALNLLSFKLTLESEEKEGEMEWGSEREEHAKNEQQDNAETETPDKNFW